jgi:hypothetical protein
VRAGSPAIDKGVSITGNGDVDFWGGALYARTADIGPYEAPTGSALALGPSRD